jgi:hypothetical protein
LHPEKLWIGLKEKFADAGENVDRETWTLQNPNSVRYAFKNVNNRVLFFCTKETRKEKKNPIFLQNNAGIATEWRFTWLIEAAQQDFTGDNWTVPRRISCQAPRKSSRNRNLTPTKTYAIVPI